MSDFAVSQGIQLRSDTPTSALKEITSKLDGLAVIIKHADYPLYMNYGNPDLENIDQALAKFLFPLFNLKERVRFVFLSKCYPVLLCRDMFGEVLDGIVDISRMPRFAAVTGFTPAEAKRKYLSDAETLSGVALRALLPPVRRLPLHPGEDPRGEPRGRGEGGCGARAGARLRV